MDKLTELKNHLKEQYKFIIKRGKDFDDGEESEAKNIATHIRVLVHNNPNTKNISLFSQLEKAFGIKTKILTKATALGESATFYAGLTVEQGPKKGPHYVAMMDLSHPALREIETEEWWEEVILLVNGQKYTRRDIIGGLANKDGGTHVDPNEQDRYFKITREIKPFESQVDLGKFELVMARESGFYVCKAIEKYFSEFIAM